MAERRSGTRSPGVNLLGIGLGQGLDETSQGTGRALHPQRGRARAGGSPEHRRCHQDPGLGGRSRGGGEKASVTATGVNFKFSPATDTSWGWELRRNQVSGSKQGTGPPTDCSSRWLSGRSGHSRALVLLASGTDASGRSPPLVAFRKENPAPAGCQAKRCSASWPGTWKGPAGCPAAVGTGRAPPASSPPSLLAPHLHSPWVVNLPPGLPLPFQNRGTPEQIPSSSCSLAVSPSLSLTNSNQMIVTSTMQLQTRTEDPEKRFGETGTQLHEERSDLIFFLRDLNCHSR